MLHLEGKGGVHISGVEMPNTFYWPEQTCLPGFNLLMSQECSASVPAPADQGSQYHLPNSLHLSEIPEIPSEHLKPRCSSPNTAVCGLSEGVKKGVKNFHVGQGNVDIFV